MLPKKVLKKAASTNNMMVSRNTILNKMKKTATFKENPELVKNLDEKDKIINMNIPQFLR